MPTARALPCARRPAGFAKALLLALALAAPALQAAPVSAQIHSTSFVTSDGVRLHVLEAGQGTPDQPVVAFVPGWTMPASLWRGQLSALGARFRVVALDPRGQGMSEIPAGGYSIDRRSDDIREFVARYPRVVLVGWSLGALEALHYVHRNGEGRLAGLVLVDSSVGEEPASPAGGGFQAELRRDRRAAVDAFVRAIFRMPQPEAELAALTESALRMPVEDSISLFPSSLPREHWRGIARGFTKPLLYVVTPQFAAQADNLKKQRPATRVEVFANAGHALFVDEPGRFAALLSAFAAEHKLMQKARD